MRLMTLNTHSLLGEDTEKALDILCAEIARREPDMVTLQEVNQSRSATLYQEALPGGYRFCQDRVVLRQDHYGIRLLKRLQEKGFSCDWSWLPVKVGYKRFDEGLLTISRRPMSEVRAIRLSEDRPYEDWRRRMALFVRTEGRSDWFVNLHMSWWRDTEEPFLAQWRRLLGAIPKGDRVWLMGDFNNDAGARGEGYDLVASNGFIDCFSVAQSKNGEETAVGVIDGWRDAETRRGKVRIDQIWCNRPIKVVSYETMFDGRATPPLSDHFGVWVEIEYDEEGERE